MGSPTLLFHRYNMTRRIYVGVALLAGAFFAGLAQAQGVANDSVAVRLRRAEAAIEALQKQIAEQSESGVQSRSRASVQLFGRVLTNGFANTRRVNNVDNPQFVRPDTTAGFPARGVGMAMRQTRLGLIVRVPDVLGGAFTGDMDVDFAGGQLASSGGRTFPLVRLRTARGIVRWTHVEAMAGQESPLVSGLNPVTPAAISTPLFTAAGNLWLWLPQVRLGVESAGNVRFGAQGAVLAPTSGDPAAAFDTDNDLAERSQRPYLQARVYAKWGEAESTREIGCGVHQGWLVPATTRVSSQAVACDALVPIVGWLEVRGEYFAGQALRGLGGGGIGQNFTSTGAPLHTKGGWAQVNLHPTFTWRMGAGCGLDHPDAATTRLRNDACAAYTIVRPSGPLFLGAEFRRLRTEYAAGRVASDHMTIALGFEF
jgi:hypothetical protein